MSLAIRLTKRGHTEIECEDAVAGPVVRDGVWAAAVADGATESAYARAWAETLASAALDAALEDATLPEAVRLARRTFAARPEATAALPWYAEAKRDEGAFAAVASLRVAPDGTWTAEAVGDCVAMHLRDGRLEAAFPLDDPAAFGNRPALVASLGTEPVVERHEGTWQPGDAFVLATDALAAHLLATDPTAALALDAETFPAFVAAAREAGMTNDDVALVAFIP